MQTDLMDQNIESEVVVSKLVFPCEKRRLQSFANLFRKRVLFRIVPDALGLYVIRSLLPNYKNMITVNLTIDSIRDQMIRGFTMFIDENSLLKGFFERRDGFRKINFKDETARFGFEGWDGFSLGNSTMLIEEGELTFGSNGCWVFSGKVRMCDEMFDFNLGVDPLTGKKYRTNFKEFLVKIGSKLPGKEFLIHYVNEQKRDEALEIHIDCSRAFLDHTDCVIG